jgi:cytochrome c biogenesis protein CcmG, thiol:disulfide interchange protein DsbE
VSPAFRRVASVVLALAVIAAVAVFGLAGAGTSPSGRSAPQLPHERLAGAPTTLPTLLASAHGRPVLVVFWASWCGPCAREAPALERFARSPTGRARIVGVDWSDGLSGARSFVTSHGWTFPNVRDAEGTVGNAYRLTGLPTTFVVDAHDRIRSVLRGPQSEATLEHALAEVERGRGNQV